MKAYIIHLPQSPASVRLANKAYDSCIEHGYDTFLFNAENHNGVKLFFELNNMKEIFNTALNHYVTYKFWIQKPGMRGSVASHICLWQKCVELQEPIVILEHDALVLRPWPEIDWTDVLHLDYEGSIKRRVWRNISDKYQEVKEGSVFRMGFVPFDLPLTTCMNCVYAYAIKPSAAERLLESVYRDGFYPIDRMINEDIVSIETVHPKIAEEQPEAAEISTTSV